MFAGTMFSGRSMQDCLRVIHDDIIGLWDFRDDNKVPPVHPYLSCSI